MFLPHMLSLWNISTTYVKSVEFHLCLGGGGVRKQEQCNKEKKNNYKTEWYGEEEKERRCIFIFSLSLFLLLALSNFIHKRLETREGERGQHIMYCAWERMPWWCVLYFQSSCTSLLWNFGISQFFSVFRFFITYE